MPSQRMGFVVHTVHMLGHRLRSPVTGLIGPS
jgi:hypothetical protein